MAKQGKPSAARKGSADSKPRSNSEPKVRDERFAAAHYDPRFQRFPRAQRKVEIDERFAGMFKDPAFEAKSAVDKRGRKLGKQTQKEDLRKYYRLQNEEEDWGRDSNMALGDAEAAPDLLQSQPNSSQPSAAQAGRRPHASIYIAQTAPEAAGSRMLDQAAKEMASEQQRMATSARKQARMRLKEQAHYNRVVNRPKRSDPIGESIGRKTDTSGKFLTSDEDDAEATPTGEPSDQPDAEASSDDDSDPADQEAARAAERWATVRGLAGPAASSSSDEEDSSAEEDSSESESEAEAIRVEEWGVGAMAGNPDEEVPEIEEETSRLAVLDLDWTKVKALDILVMLKSFLAKGQSIKRVTVYPSDYGLQRMAEEAKFGPAGLVDNASLSQHLEGADLAAPTDTTAGVAPRAEKKGLSKEEQAAILETLNVQESDEDIDDESDVAEGSESSSDSGEEDGDEDNEDDDDDNVDDEDSPGLREQNRSAARSSDSKDDEVSRQRLQMYERSRLRYYYAIVECADVSTARHLYNDCDGMEFEHSASRFDLRYVPATEDFSGREVREAAEEVPLGYQPPSVGAAAMQHTRPKLTWDADDDERKRALSRRPTKEQLRDDDFKAYLGSESEEEEENPSQADAERYRQLLTGATNVHRPAAKGWGGAADQDKEEGPSRDEAGQAAQDRDMELEVTFGSGLEALGQRLKAKLEEAASQKSDTVWQAYLRRRKEKRMEAKRHGRPADSDDEAASDEEAAGADPYFKHDDSAFDDPFFQEGARVGREEAAASKPSRVAGSGGKQASAKAAGRQAKKAQEEADRQRRAELELLLMDDSALQDMSKLGGKAEPEAAQKDEAPRGKLSHKARVAAKRAARAAKRGAASDDEDVAPKAAGFNVDVSDSRFAALFTSPEFALDPTDPRFAASEGTQKILREAARRRNSKGGKNSTAAAVKVQAEHVSGGELKALVASLKRRGGTQEAKQGKHAKKHK